MNSSGSKLSRQLEAYEARKLVYEAIGSLWSSETPKPKPKPRPAKRRAKRRSKQPKANPTPTESKASKETLDWSNLTLVEGPFHFQSSQKKKKKHPQQIEDVESKDVELEDEDLNQQTEDECYEEIYALKVFRKDFITMYRNQHPEELDGLNMEVDNWWMSIPSNIKKIARQQWKNMAEAEAHVGETDTCVESEDVESENDDLNGPEYIFLKDFITMYRNQHPEELDGLNMEVDNWWMSIPTNIKKIARQQWKNMAEAEAHVGETDTFVESEDVESENEDLIGPEYIFLKDFITMYRNQHPEELDGLNMEVDNWWMSIPSNIKKIALQQWKNMAEAEKLSFVTLFSEIGDECCQEVYAMNEFGKDHFNIQSDNAMHHFMQEEVAKAWEKATDEVKAGYLKVAKQVVDQMRKMEREK